MAATERASVVTTENFPAIKLAEDGCEAIVLGCAGMADLANSLAQEHGAPIVDGAAAAVKFCEALAALGLKTAKRGGYATPQAKTYAGEFGRHSP